VINTRPTVTLAMVFGFFSVLGLVLIIETMVFGIPPSESQLTGILVGALIGSVTTIVAFFFEENRKENSK